MMRSLLILLLTTILCMVAACKPKASTDAIIVAQGLKVRAQEVTKGSIENHLSLSSRIEPWEKVMVVVKFPGKLVRRNVVEGQAVDKDEVLALVNIDEIGMESNDYEVKAPIAGVVAELSFDPGSFVAPSAPLMVVMNIDTVKTTVNIIESEIANVHKGVRATINVPAYPDRAFRGTVNNVLPIVDPMSHTTKAEIQIGNLDHTLKPGMSATVVLSIGRHDNVVTIPKDAMIEKLGETYVFLYTNGVAKKADIKAGYDDGSRVEIIEGVNAGDTIITTDINVLVDGTKVQVQEEP